MKFTNNYVWKRFSKNHIINLMEDLVRRHSLNSSSQKKKFCIILGRIINLIVNKQNIIR